jgi:hypothetical protein
MNFEDIIAEKMKLYEQPMSTQQQTQQPAQGQQQTPQITPEQLLAFALKVEPNKLQTAGINPDQPDKVFDQVTKLYLQSLQQEQPDSNQQPAQNQQPGQNQPTQPGQIT